MSKNTFAPHTNITIVIMNGMMVHSSSSASDPWMSAPTSSSCRRRYLIGEDHDQRRDEQREERGDRQHEEIDAVDLRRLGGRLLREERKIREHR